MQTIKPKRGASIFSVGDYIESATWGAGVVVGFGEHSGTPVVFYYSKQELVWTEDERIKKLK